MIEKTYCKLCEEITDHEISIKEHECLVCGLSRTIEKEAGRKQMEEVDIKELILNAIYEASLKKKELQGYQIMEELRGTLGGIAVSVEESLISNNLQAMTRAVLPLIKRRSRGCHERGPLAIRFGVWSLTVAGLKQMREEKG